MVSAKNTTLEIYLKELANDYRSPRLKGLARDARKLGNRKGYHSHS